MPDVDFTEVVTLIALPEGARAEYERGGPLPPMSLAKAVRTVVVDWAGEPLRQASAAIVREEGRPLLQLAEIRELFDRPDFPTVRQR